MTHSVCWTVSWALLCLGAASVKEPVPVAPFKNVCALTAQKIEAFIACTQDFSKRDEKIHLVTEFNNQVKQIGSLPRSEVIKMVCRSVGDDGTMLIAEYLDGLGPENNDYMADVMKKCGFTG